MSSVEKQVKTWLKKYGKTFAADGYPECDMVDSCMYDLSLDEQYRDLVNQMVDIWIVNH